MAWRCVVGDAVHDFDAASATGDDILLKSAIAENTKAHQDLAVAAPSSLRSEPRVIADAWTKFNRAVQSTSPEDPFRRTAGQEFEAGPAVDAREVRAVDAYITATCGSATSTPAPESTTPPTVWDYETDRPTIEISGDGLTAETQGHRRGGGPSQHRA